LFIGNYPFRTKKHIRIFVEKEYEKYKRKNSPCAPDNLILFVKITQKSNNNNQVDEEEMRHKPKGEFRL
jgi:hypothetical protein